MPYRRQRVRAEAILSLCEGKTRSRGQGAKADAGVTLRKTPMSRRVQSEDAKQQAMSSGRLGQGGQKQMGSAGPPSGTSALRTLSLGFA